MGTCRKEIIQSNKGSTMIETLVSFVVLFLVLGALYSIVSFSSELYMRSVDISRLQQRFFKEIYKSRNIDDSFVEIKKYGPNEVDTDAGETLAGNAGLILSLDKTKTDQRNYNHDTNLSESYISLKNIGATTYVCIEGENTTGSTDEDSVKNGIKPKAIVFSYKK